MMSSRTTCFKPFGIAQVERQIENRDGQEFRGEQVRNRNDDEQNDHGCDPGDGDGKLTRGDGAIPLFRVIAIRFDIGDVVDDVNDAGKQAEQDEACQNVEDGREIGQLSIEDQGDEQEDVFGPLFGTHGFDDLFKHGEMIVVNV